MSWDGKPPVLRAPAAAAPRAHGMDEAHDPRREEVLERGRLASADRMPSLGAADGNVHACGLRFRSRRCARTTRPVLVALVITGVSHKQTARAPRLGTRRGSGRCITAGHPHTHGRLCKPRVGCFGKFGCIHETTARSRNILKRSGIQRPPRGCNAPTASPVAPYLSGAEAKDQVEPGACMHHPLVPQRDGDA